MSKETGGKMSGMLKGLKDCMPKPPGMGGDPKLPSRKVSAEATRNGTAPTPKTLGPRSA